MQKNEFYNQMFFTAYHSEDMSGNVKKFLRENFPSMADNRHFSAMIHFCNTIAEQGQDTCHPMILGMLCDAWKQFLVELN